MLPNESLLQVLHFADYRTLVLAKLAGARFQRLATKFADQLARCRFFVYFYTNYIEYDDVTTGAGGSFPYEPRSFAAACQALAEVIGPPHAVVVLTFYGNTWRMPYVGVAFGVAPPLKYAEDVVLHSPDGSSIGGNSVAFMSNFVGAKSLRVWLNEDVFRHFNWAFLREEYTRELRRIAVFAMPAVPTEFVHRYVASFVSNYAKLPRLLGGDPVELDFSDNFFSRAFGLHIIELLKNSARNVLFRMSTLREGELTLDQSDYTVDVGDTTIRYTSEKSGIVVEVMGRRVAVQSTAAGPSEEAPPHIYL